MFYAPEDFEFTSHLQKSWRNIRDEYFKIDASTTDWHETDLYQGGWKVYQLFDLSDGKPHIDRVADCPITSKVIADHLPNHIGEGFSVLKPNTRIKPHQGYLSRVLRCHLALKVPQGDCGLKVGEETRAWSEGMCLVFDDRVTHEAWNLASEDRVVLLIDFLYGQP